MKSCHNTFSIRSTCLSYTILGLPVFSVHGNHDDPSGLGGYSVLDNLHAAGLINYFGKVSNLKDIEVSPLLLTKGKTKLSLYGMSSVKDERLHRLFRENRVKMYRPEEDTEEWFNLLVLHQNRVARGPTNHIPEHFIDGFFDLVLWGHEHDCRLTPEKVVYGEDKTFHITQPGSSVATSLCDGEALQKRVGILDIAPGRLFKLEEVPLKTVRPMIFKTIWIEDPELGLQSQFKSADHKKVHASIEKYLIKYINKLLKEELPPLLTGHPSQPTLPLVRVRVEYTDDSHQLTASRFGNNFHDKVANPNEILLFKRRVVKREAGEVTGFSKDAFDAIMPIDFDDMISMEDLISQYFVEAGKGNADERKKNEMKLLGVKGVGSAVNRFIEKEDKDSIGCIVDRQFQKTVDRLMSIADIEDEQVDEQLGEFKQERARMTGSLDLAKLEAEEAEAALDAPNRKSRTEVSVNDDNLSPIDDISDENVPPAIQSTRGAKGRGRGSTRGNSKAKISAVSGRGRGRAKKIVPESDEEVEEGLVNQNQTANLAQKSTRTAVPSSKGRYGSVVGFSGKAQPLTQTSIVSAFSRQSQSMSNSSRVSTKNVPKKKSILYDSDSD